MSCAFVKEPEDHVVEFPDRPISPNRNFVTAEGLRAIKTALGVSRRPTEQQSTKAISGLPQRLCAKCDTGQRGMQAPKLSSEGLIRIRWRLGRQSPCAGMTVVSKHSES